MPRNGIPKNPSDDREKARDDRKEAHVVGRITEKHEANTDDEDRLELIDELESDGVDFADEGDPAIIQYDGAEAGEGDVEELVGSVRVRPYIRRKERRRAG